MKIAEIIGNEAVVESGGLKKKIGLHLVRNIRIGDYVIVHAGFAIEKLDKKRAQGTLKILKEMGSGR